MFSCPFLLFATEADRSVKPLADGRLDMVQHLFAGGLCRAGLRGGSSQEADTSTLPVWPEEGGGKSEHTGLQTAHAKLRVECPTGTKGQILQPSA